MVKKNSIPNGWRTVSPIGHPLPGTRFIAFKVPLKGTVNQRLTPTQKFTPKDLISAIKALNVELGLIIDLTYTTRYYEVKDLPKSIHYKKLYTVGLEVPDNATILQFKKWVRKFLWENAENDKLIGVHCTNGINRTGYLICRYLIDVEGWEPDTAIQAFGEARGHQIDGCVYLKDLKTRPMRSNLGMDVWGSDDDTILPSNSMEESRDWPSNEDFHGPGKKSRLPNDHHPQNGIQIEDYDYINNGPAKRHGDFYKHQCNDSMPEELCLSDWDFGNKEPRPKCSFFDKHQYLDVSQKYFSNKGPAKRPRPFHDLQPHSEFYEPEPVDDLDFVKSIHGQRTHSIHNHHTYSNFQGQFQTKNVGFVNRSQGQKQRPFHKNHDYSPKCDFQDQLPDQGLSYINRGNFQRQRHFHQHYSNDEMSFEDLAYTDEVSGHTLGPLHYRSKNDFTEKMPLKKCVNRGNGQRLPPFQKFQNQMKLRNFDLNYRIGPRQIFYYDHPSCDLQEQISLEDLDFEHETSLERPRSFQAHPLPDNINSKQYLDKNFGTDNYKGRSQRVTLPEDNRRIINPSNVFNYWGQNRFTPYSSHGLPFSYVLQEHGAADNCRGKNLRNVEQYKSSYF
nr:uncharacterized protein LOC101432221 isoform X1 [Dasypus novemcinctus]